MIQTYNRVRDAFPEEGVTVDVAVKGDDVRSGAGGRRHRAAASGEAENSDEVLQGTEVDLQRGRHRRPDLDPDRRQRQRRRVDGGAERDPRRRSSRPRSAGSTGVTVNVSGDAAQSKDFRDQLVDRLPLIFAFVFALAFLLMLVTFRSIVIPIKAILLNLLSVGAAYGVLVLVFQDGRGESLLGFTSNGGVTSWLPLFLFVILFGLSMDYHVFILSRVREAYQGGMSTTRPSGTGSRRRPGR